MVSAKTLSFGIACLLRGVQADLTVKLGNGLTVQGRTSPIAASVAEFLGIPYAEPPVGELRWEPPQPYEPKGYSVINATALPPSCWQYISVHPAMMRTDVPEFMIGKAGMSEDCLTTSVWVPTKAVSQTSELPVIIWFYGGGFATGGTDVPYQIPTKWIERSQDHILVSFNYRINLFGFPDAAGATEQNLGLMDQRLAVEWVRDNIKAFGGDPDRMVIWGQSAGSVAVDYYNFAFADDPIVGGFIMNSGTAHLNQLMSNDVIYSNFSFVAEGVGCGNQPDAASELACMKKVPAEKLENFVATYEDSGDSPSITFAPMVDEKLVFANYTERAARGALSTLPALITHNAQEGLFIAPYSVDGPDPAIAEGLSKTFFWCPTFKTTKERLAAGRITHRAFYNGNFSNISPRPWFGAWHGSDLPLAFGTHADFRGNSTALEYETSHAIQDAYVAFAKDPVQGLDEMGWAAYAGARGVVRAYAENNTAVGYRSLDTIESECEAMGLA
ncbi:hypothetical protein PG993_001733 [Apiospora rasikravindrae]|uniref:Carboxylic ester hydrolase n=1 Tax=Apiospora rasikravindrae TaxID=990691 RepID=A0ABR1UC84_9PEZI